MSSVNSLEYNDIRNSIVEFLKQDPYFKNFNFEASNFSRLINILSYSSMYNGYYMKMLLDESMPDSARTKTALIGHANSRNYLTKFISASKAIIGLNVEAEDIVVDDVPYIQITRGQSFKGANKDGKSIYFINPYDVTLLYNSTTQRYEGDEFLILQGQYRTLTYNVTDRFKKYIINDINCDDTTISVKIKSNKDAINGTEYIRNVDFYDVDAEDFCYYITASTNNVYQIHFGHDIFGREPRVGETIEITYIKTEGSSSNDVSKFEIVATKKPDTPPTNINFYKNVYMSISTAEASSGGLDSETTDELRFGILNYTRVRGRAVTPDDIKSIIMSEFRDIDSINVWSGGSAKYRRYGKTYISIKPRTGELLTYSAKKVITDLMVDRYGVISKTDIIFVDPNFTDILLTVKFKINRSLTNSNSASIKANIETIVSEFNKNTLSKFDINFYDTDITTLIRTTIPSISTVFTQKLLQKTIVLNYSAGRFQIDFGNAIRNMTSSLFTYGNLQCKLKNVENKVYIIDGDDNTIANIGTCNLENGTFDIIIPQYVSAELINIIVEPIYVDINTLEDNIVRIKTITVAEVM